MSQNNKNNKPGKNSNLRGMLSLVAWALLLTVVFTYAGAYIEQDMDDATQREIAYSEFKNMVKDGLVEKAILDSSTGLILITPVEDYVYTDEDGKTYEEIEFYTDHISDDTLYPLLDEYGVYYTHPHKAQISPILTN